MEFNFDEVRSGGLHEKRAVATGNLGTVSVFALSADGSQGNVCRGGPSRDLTDTYTADESM
jgi:hypothetical protein